MFIKGICEFNRILVMCEVKTKETEAGKFSMLLKWLRNGFIRLIIKNEKISDRRGKISKTKGDKFRMQGGIVRFTPKTGNVGLKRVINSFVDEWYRIAFCQY